MPRSINALGLKLIETFEECRLSVYNDNPSDPSNGVWTIGWGHTGPDVYEGMPDCTQEQADAWLEQDLAGACGSVERRIKVPLNDNQFSALVSFEFNTGGISGHQQDGRPWTIVRLLNGGFYDQVPNELAHQTDDGVWHGWVHQNGQLRYGLVRRRMAEIQLWNTPVQL